MTGLPTFGWIELFSIRAPEWEMSASTPAPTPESPEISASRLTLKRRLRRMSIKESDIRVLEEFPGLIDASARRLEPLSPPPRAL